MQDLRLVGLSEDSEHVLLADDQGGRYRLPLDHALRSAVRHERPRPAGDDTPTSLSPREVQALIRAGASAEEVAELSGWTLEKVHKYEGPIIAEREHVASLATAVRLRSRGSTSTMLSSRVAERLHARGVDAAAASWDAWRGAEGPWTLQLSFPAGGRLREARWHFDVVARTVAPFDDEARWLSEDDDATPEEAARPRGSRVFDLESEGGIDAPDETERGGDRPAPQAVDTEAAAEQPVDRTESPQPGAADRPDAYEVDSPGMYLHVGTRGHDADEDDQMVESMRQRSRASRRRRSAPPRSPSGQDQLPDTPVVPPAEQVAAEPAAAGEVEQVEQVAAEPTIELARDDIAVAVVDQPTQGSADAVADRATQEPTDTVGDPTEAADPAIHDELGEGYPEDETSGAHPDDERPAREPEEGGVDVTVTPAPGPTAAAAGPEHVPGQVTLPELDASTPAAHPDPEVAERPTPPVPDPDQPAPENTPATEPRPESKPAPEGKPATEPAPEGKPATEDQTTEQPEARPTGRAARRATQQRRRSGRTSVPSWDDVMFGSKKPDND